MAKKSSSNSKELSKKLSGIKVDKELILEDKGTNLELEESSIQKGGIEIVRELSVILDVGGIKGFDIPQDIDYIEIENVGAGDVYICEGKVEYSKNNLLLANCTRKVVKSILVSSMSRPTIILRFIRSV